ncbi:MAG: radical SAM protein [bacterium]
MKVGAIVQAVAGGERFRNKCLESLNNKPMIFYVVDALRGTTLRDNIIIFSAEGGRNDIFCELAREWNVSCYLGEENVLSRMISFLEKNDFDVLVRSFGNNNLLNGTLIDKLLRIHIDGGFDYTFVETDDIPLENLFIEIVNRNVILELRGKEKDFRPNAYLRDVISKGPKTNRYFLDGEDRRCFLEKRFEELYDFPRNISIEVTKLCNLRCKMCALHSDSIDHPQAKGHPPYMKFSDIKRLAEEIKSLNPDAVCSPQFQGEPFLHPDFLKIVEFFSSLGLKTSFVTNGTLLGRNQALSLVENGVDTVCVSIDGATKDTYERIRIGSNYERVVKNLEFLIKCRDGREFPRIGVSYTLQSENEDEFELFLERWIDRVDYVNANNVAVDGVPVKKNFDLDFRYPCPHLWDTVIVLTNGDVAPCCRDYKYEEVMGNVFEESIRDIWRGEKYRMFRELHLRGEYDKIPICGNCDTWSVRTKNVEERDGRIVEVYPSHRVFRRGRF